jgi:hypothetical protein
MVYVGFSTPKLWNPLSWAIRAATHAEVSHAWLLVEDPLFDHRLVLEAASTGFRLVPLSRFVLTERVVALLEPAADVTPGLRQAGDWLGEKFDVRGLVGMALLLLAERLGLRGLRNPLRSRRALFCSEAVVRTLRAAGYPGADRLGVEETTPAALLAFLLAQPGTRRVDGAALSTGVLTGAQRRDLRARPGLAA